MLQDYKFLTYARIPAPAPPPWVETHTLVQAAITAFVKQQAGQLPDWQHRLLASAAANLDLEWYTSMLARLHINSFRFASALGPADWCLQQSVLRRSVGLGAGFFWYNAV